ncbi:MAG: hypothetical protein J3Q66DRAFT_349779 [Benniella sp.]|nr:MAG: hypothetical protein J3Q66DRAFT_349779 [Benniella sp.]
MASVLRTKSWFKSTKKHHKQKDLQSQTSTISTTSSSSPSPPSSASAPNSAIPSANCSSSCPSSSSSSSSSYSSPSVTKAANSTSQQRSVQGATPVYSPTETTTTPNNRDINSDNKETTMMGLASKNKFRHLSSFPSLPSFSLLVPRRSMISTSINKKNSVSNISNTGHSKSMIPFLRNRNSSFQSLQTAAQQQQQEQQQQQQQPKNQQGQEQYQTPNPAFAKNNSNVNSSSTSSSSIQSGKDVPIDMNSLTKGKGLIRRTNVPPAAPNANKISAAGQEEQHQQRQVQRMSSVQSKPSPGAAAGHKMLFRNISARFHPSTELIPVVETVAQEYARTIKALWRMVEEEELSYQIDAAATAARQRQEELQRLVAQNNSTATKPRHNFKTFPAQRVHHRIGQSDDDDSEMNGQICRDACCCKQEGQSRAAAAASAVKGNRLSSSSSVPNDDDDCEDPEEQEERLRELQQLERELVILGLHQYQDASIESEPSPQEQQSPSSCSRQYDSRRESFQESAVQPGWPVEQAVQIEQTKPTSPPQQPQQPQRRQRQRQNSLAYEERRADLDALRAQVKAAAVETVPAASSPLLSFRDGVREGGAENDDDDDAVVVKVARRVSVRLHTQSHHDWSTFLEQDRQRPSYDVERARGRGASWAPPPRTTTLANAKRHSRMLSMSEVKATTTPTPPVVSTMVSAR